MALVNGENLRKHYGPQEIFQHLSFRIENGDRIGLVGPNGAGKSTLIKLLIGLEEPTEGQIGMKQGLRIGYLPQKPPPLKGVTLWDAMLEAFAEVRRLEQEMHQLTEDMADEKKHDVAMEKYAEAQHEFEMRGGYVMEQRIRTVLMGLGFSEEQHAKPLSDFSGGQRTRAFLAKLLLEDPELLVLDEPTNHLDLDSVEWLEGWLSEYQHGLLVVSHDRYFLDKVTTRTWELSFGTLEPYRGNYSHYLRQREERFRDRLALWESQQVYIEKTQEFIRRFLAGQRSKEAQGRRSHLERFMRDEAIPKPRKHATVRILLDTKRISGDLILQLRDLQAGYEPGKPIVKPPNLEVRRTQRVAFVGPNGSGKTTMLRTLMSQGQLPGQLAPLAGNVRFGAGIQIGYLSQAQDDLEPQRSVLETILACKEKMTDQEGRTILGSFLFTGDDVFKKVATLSGGERSRLALARISVRGATVLMLDEPTNHLDISSQEELTEALEAYEGTIFFVSHDRYLVQALATHLWIVQDGSLTEIEGNWDTYLAWRKEQTEAAADEKPTPKPAPKPEPKAEAAAPDASAEAAEDPEVARAARNAEQKRKKQAAKAQQKQQELEAKIKPLEARIAALNEEITQAGQRQDRDAVVKLGQEYNQADADLKALWEEWVHWGEQSSDAPAEKK